MKSDMNYIGVEKLSAAAVENPGTVRIPRPEPIVKADDVAYIMFCKKSLERQKAFLLDFGMVISAETPEAIYMRGTGPLPYFYVAFDAQKMKPRPKRHGFLGIGFSVKTAGELDTLSKATGVTIEPIDGPGAGNRVRLSDPDGFIVDVCHGRQMLERLDSRAPIAVNTPLEKRRVNEAIRTPILPSPIERLGHAVLSVTSLEVSQRWYMRHLGLIPSDVQCIEDGSPVLAFNRLNRGAELADHHSLVLTQNVMAQYMHSAYETLDLDSIGQGHQYLASRGWSHHWGIGRHILGSQIFDYWKDPEGEELEHYADGDVFDSARETRYHPMDLGGLYAWGAEVPNIAPKPTPSFIMSVVRSLRSGKMTARQLGLLKKAMSTKARPWSR
ncbi:VOC family protein [Solimonas terrae]|uniref:VOC domain-containing protein n=1 Tax=Solimonas terrae TaxID=1396819 RepID=A0A6M2BMR8_9GAMM|nr:VOC family protein [Solimonas terrae]NGY03313.1 hypothetical protein [Solimonas terrae]